MKKAVPLGAVFLLFAQLLWMVYNIWYDNKFSYHKIRVV